jgi:LAO/AO transport system kinase
MRDFEPHRHGISNGHPDPRPPYWWPPLPQIPRPGRSFSGHPIPPLLSPDALAEAVIAGDRRAAARAVTVIENRRTGADTLVDALYPHTGRAWRIGITGPPGAGKSTITDRLIGHFREAGCTVAAVAVDPSSPFTGGALLGDRVRLTERVGDRGTFFRSLAARGAGGGLSEAAEAACDVFDAAGFDVVLLETVGVGQGELDVAEAADTVLVVVVPESGDAVQAMKAGLMEIADVFCVNKSDHPEAGEMVRALRDMLRLRPGFGTEGVWVPPVVKVVATRSEGLEELVEALEAHRAHLGSEGWDAHRAARLQRRVRRLVEAGWRDQFWTSERRAALDEVVATMDGAERAPHRLAARVLDGA